MIIIDVVFVLDLALVVLELGVVFEFISVITLLAPGVVVAVGVSIAAAIADVLFLAVRRAIAVSAIPRSSLVVVAFPIAMAKSIGLTATARL